MRGERGNLGAFMEEAAGGSQRGGGESWVWGKGSQDNGGITGR